MNWNDVINAVLPIATLLLGAALARGTNRGRMRIESAATIAELERMIWTKDDGAWLDLKVFLAKLRVHLRAAGVPAPFIADLSNACETHWNRLHDSHDPEIGWYASPEQTNRVEITRNRVLDWIDQPWNLARHRRLLLARASD